MKKISLRNEWLIWLVMLLPVLLCILFWKQVPDEIPVHFGLSGQPDRYASRLSALLIFSVLNLVVYLGMLLLPGIDPLKENYAKFEKSYRMLRLSIAALFSCLFLMAVAAALQHPAGQPRFLFTILFVFFAIFGNYMKTVKPNFFIGIRTPWTLSSTESWRKTHSLTGKIWFLGGIAGTIFSFLLPMEWIGILMLVFIIVSVIAALGASYYYYKMTSDREAVKK